MTIVVDASPLGRALWGAMPLPQGADYVGTVVRDGYDTGALLLLPSGIYVQGNAGSVRTLPQQAVCDALRDARIDDPVRAAAAVLGRKGGMAGRGAAKARPSEQMSRAGKLGAAKRRGKKP